MAQQDIYIISAIAAMRVGRIPMTSVSDPVLLATHDPSKCALVPGSFRKENHVSKVIGERRVVMHNRANAGMIEKVIYSLFFWVNLIE